VSLDIYCDGASRSNPGEASVGITIMEQDIEIDIISRKIGIATNNVAEYQALIDGLKYCNDNNVQNVSFYLDSKLVVEQISGNFKVKSEHLKVMYGEAKVLISKIDNFTINHIYRVNNKRADELANQALDN
jgi:ribonuclease HI|tara:strand:+ start:112 stop:504 length:393 start_codon:yes stop_codon:yes gene_type:complete